MPVFYAKAHNIRDENTWRVLLIFASRAVADEWWHAISAGPLSLLSAHIQQISPDFYTHDPSHCNILYFFSDSRFKAVSEIFRGRLFLTLENDRGGRQISTLPRYSDSVSGVDDSSLGFPSDAEGLAPGPATKPSNPSPPIGQSERPLPPAAIAQGPTTELSPVPIPVTSPIPQAPTVHGPAIEPLPVSPPVTLPRQIMAAIIMPDDPNAPEIYSKYIVIAKYKPSVDHPEMRAALLVNSDVGVPRFKSRGASHSGISETSLSVEFRKLEDLTGFALFNGAIGRGEIRFVTDKLIHIHGPIEGGPKESQSFVGTGTWTLS